MNGRRRGQWWLETFGMFLGAAMLWALGAWLLFPAGAHPASLGISLRSHLIADYGPDEVERAVGVLRIEVVEEALRDRGLPTEQASDQMRTVVVAMSVPVPSSTPALPARRAASSATPVASPMPLSFSPSPEEAEIQAPTESSRSQEAEPSVTRIAESQTPMPSATEPTASSPTDPPTPTPTSLAAASPTQAPRRDRSEPSIREVTTDPRDGQVEGCVLRVVDMRVTDRSPSSGIELADVYFWYSHDDRRSDDFPAELVSGGWESGPGSRWEAHYSGTLALTGRDHDRLSVWARASDGSGNRDTRLVGSFRLAGDCP